MSKMGTTLEDIRSQTRLALPADDGYLFRLGVALYGFSSINSFMCEIITHLDPNTSHTDLQDRLSSEVLRAFRAGVRNWTGSDISDPADRAADEFRRLTNERNDFVHAYPITNSHEEQILHRRKDSQGKYFEVSSEFLDGFISRLHEVSSALYEIRGIVRPNL